MTRPSVRHRILQALIAAFAALALDSGLRAPAAPRWAGGAAQAAFGPPPAASWEALFARRAR